ncbi:hypothetical protein BGX26_006273 [Mortierella sp. AD094]|nr:hypothetical protein BGX26_006273 [Mortierella sp. AD094]
MNRLSGNHRHITRITPGPGAPQGFQDEEDFVAIFLQPFVFQEQDQPEGQDEEELVVNALQQLAIQGQDQHEDQGEEELAFNAHQQLVIQGQGQPEDQDEGQQEPPENIPDGNNGEND